MNTIRCPDCDGALELTGDNGATDPSETRIEFYECVSCGAELRQTLPGRA